MRLIGFLILGLFPLTLFAQQSKRSAVLYGSVLTDPNDRPIVGAEVIVSPTLSARTDSAGEFSIKVPPGAYQVMVRHVGNAPLSALMAFAPGDSLGRDFVLAVEATQLDTVHIVAPAVSDFIRLGKMAGFEERKKDGFGTFFDAATLEKQHDRRLSEIIQSRAQVRVMQLGSGAAIATRRGISLNGPSGDGTDRRRGAKPACYSAVWIDGLRVYYPASGKALFDINSLSPDMLQGVEFYPSSATTPTQYSGLGANCGTLLIWTK